MVCWVREKPPAPTCLPRPSADQKLHHLRRGISGRLLIRTQMDLGRFGWLVGRTDAGEVGDLARTRLGVQALDVALFTHGQWRSEERRVGKEGSARGPR